MRWGLVVALTLLIAAPAASAAHAQVTIQATPTTGAAPLHVTFTAGGAAAAHWDFGDGTSADGPTVQHIYAAGRWTATASVRGSDGATTHLRDQPVQGVASVDRRVEQIPIRQDRVGE